MGSENEKYFNEALSRFVKDFACRNEVIAKYKHGKSVEKIKSELTYPISMDEINSIINEYNEN